ncbi:MAG: 4Fe-4S binding protein [Desulfamplus sp.]|nr:4Fe-4S binding protein [Desulfamplus sp.]
MTIRQPHMIERSNFIRKLIQILFFVIVTGIGVRFYQFVSLIDAGVLPGFERPPGVEAFLPISALVSLKYFLFTGKINPIHPSALVLFLIICMTALILKKGFCSWICPFGFLSEFLGKLHFRIFKKGLSIPLWMDLILRSLKYIIAVFFIWNISYQMPLSSVEEFIQSPYNRFADIKMLKFFTRISATAFTIILILSILSIIIRNCWCRYLCPYGALLGVISFLSVGRIIRNPLNCTKCGKCEKTCPGLIKIRQKDQINSSECTACMECINICPEKDAIGFSLFSGKFSVNELSLALILLLFFTIGISMAKHSGKWQNNISKNEYLDYSTTQSTFTWSTNRQIDPHKMEKMVKMMKKMKNQGAYK